MIMANHIHMIIVLNENNIGFQNFEPLRKKNEFSQQFALNNIVHGGAVPRRRFGNSCEVDW